ncbi:XRE family transcriptional regulator [Vibrio sp. T187]|uniref:helix-turn-helix domain-containing protein n=1 Tax=Vibrio TaxID=662 RepID=UPI0010C9D861|nr:MULTISPECIES: helix-turn-helix transcriptional regulator [Vibrio]MBW3695404.1 XRE family transcriptional regulator [Vibrio sp. T187]
MSQEPIVMALINRRKLAGFSQEKMASVAGMSLKTYQRIERGETDIKVSQYRSIMRALNLTDLDIALDTLDVSKVIPADVAAASRLLSDEARLLLVKLILLIQKDKQSE